MTAPQIITTILSSVGCMGYVYGIYLASRISLESVPNTSKMPTFLSSVVTSIGAIMATNLGVLLGFKIKEPTKSLNFFLDNLLSDPKLTDFQILAAYIYVLSLIASIIVWGIKNFTDNPQQIVPIIPELSKTLLGVIVGVTALSLSIDTI